MLNSAVEPAPVSYAEMKSKIVQQNLKKATDKSEQIIAVHYSICNKQSKMVSILTHQRLLILNEGEGTIYYANQTQNTPFKTYDKLPKPKNYFAHLNLCVVKQENPQSNILIILFNVKVKGQSNPQAVQWRFEMGNKQLAFNWQQLVREKKIERMSRAIGIDTRDKNTLGTIHDTLSFTLLGVPAQGSKISPIKNKEDELEQADRKGMSNFLMQFGEKQKVQKTEEKPIASKTSILDRSSEKPMQASNVQSKAVSEVPQNPQPQASKIKIKQEQMEVIDWNLRYLQKAEESTITQFAQQAKKRVLGMKIETLKLKGQREQQQVIVKKNEYGLNIQITRVSSQHAKRMREQFANYSYIAQCLKYAAKPCVSIPLACLIQYKGVLALANSSLPQNAKTIQKSKLQQQNPFSTTVLSYFKELERHTKIDFTALINNCSIFNLTTEYGLNKSMPNIFIDDLTFYLPYYPKIHAESGINPSIKYPHNMQMRSELISNNFTRVINTNLQKQEVKTSEELMYYISQSLKLVASILVSQQIIICSYFDLECIMNEYGLGLEMLPQLYYVIDTQLKKEQAPHLRSLLSSVLAARLIHTTECLPLMDQLRQNNNINAMEESLTGIVKKYCEGGSALNSECWKRMNTQYNKFYGIGLNFNQIEGGILLSSLLYLCQCQFSKQKLNKSKQLLKQQEAVQTGLISKLVPKLTFYSNTTLQCQKIKTLCCDISERSALGQLDKYGVLTNKERRQQFFSAEPDKYLLPHLISYHLSHLTQTQLINDITATVNHQPPQSLWTHTMAINYFKHRLSLVSASDAQKQQCVHKINSYMAIISYWLGSRHPYLCDTYDCLISALSRSQAQEMRNYANESLQISKKMCGVYNFRTADKYVKFGTLLHLGGNNQDAKMCFNQAKTVYQSQIDKYIQQYALLTNKIARQQLEDGNFDASILMAQLSNRKLRKIQQILQINDNKSVNYKSSTKNEKKRMQKKIWLTSDEINKTAIDNYIIMARGYEASGNKEGLRQIGELMEQLLREQQQPILFGQMLKICVIGFLNSLSPYKLHLLHMYISNLLARENDSKMLSKNRLAQRLLHSPSSIFQRMHTQLQNYQLAQIQQMLERNKVESMEGRQFRQLWQYICGCMGNTDVLSAIENAQQI